MTLRRHPREDRRRLSRNAGLTTDDLVVIVNTGLLPLPLKVPSRLVNLRDIVMIRQRRQMNALKILKICRLAHVLRQSVARTGMERGTLMKYYPLALAVIVATGFSSCLSAAPVLWSSADGGNDHYYELVLQSNLPWQSAKTLAEASSYLGASGYLATITSQAENDFIVNAFSNSILSAWIGLTDSEQFGGSESSFVWITGEPLQYTNWRGGEPNNTDHGSGLGEDFGEIILWETFSGYGQWNDLDETYQQSFSYLVEYDVVPEVNAIYLSTMFLGVFATIYLRKQIGTKLTIGR